MISQIENIQYNASSTITGAIKETARFKLHKEIGLEPHTFRRLFRKLCTFFQIKINGLPSDLFDLIPKSSHMYNTRSLKDAGTIYIRTDIFRVLFWTSAISK